MTTSECVTGGLLKKIIRMKTNRKILNTFKYLAWIYLASRMLGIYPLDLLHKDTLKIHITNVEGAPGLLNGEYHVYSDKGEFVNRDSTLMGKFNSHDIQNYLFLVHERSESVHCEAEIAGYRIYGAGKLSFLPNIIKIKCN